MKYGSKKNYPILKDIIILAKYYKFQGIDIHEIRIKLLEYCYRTDPSYSETLSGWKIKKALNAIKIYRLRISFPVTITKSEVSKIKEFDDYNLQKILFVLLTYSKFLKYANTRIVPTSRTRVINEFYVNERIRNIIKATRVSLQKDKRDKFLHDAFLKGLLDGTIHNTLLIKYVDENSEPEIIVEDLDDIVLYWARYSGEKIAACSKCGRLFVKRSNRHAMCRKCFQEQRREKQREYTKKYRDVSI